MVRRLLLALALLSACFVPTTASATTYTTYTRHLTVMAAGTNTPCGPLQGFIVSAYLPRGHKFGHLGTFTLRIAGGTIKIPYDSFNLSADGRAVQWIAHDVGNAKVSTNLTLSHTTFTASPGSTWHASVKRWCYSM
ncbi:MAG: hypothetical protein ACJ716_07645 [Marmoricola sp.]